MAPVFKLSSGKDTLRIRGLLYSHVHVLYQVAKLSICNLWPKQTKHHQTFQQHKLTVLAPCSTSIDLYRSSTHTLFLFRTPICLFLPSNHLLFLTRPIHLLFHCSISTSPFHSLSLSQTPSIHLVPFLSTAPCPCTAASFSLFYFRSLHSFSQSVFLPGSLLSFNWLPGGSGNFVFWLNTHL